LPLLRLTILFSGRVQGVGFRFTCERLARRFEVTGWVRNEPRGTVRCVVEGLPAEVDRFVAAVREAMSENITDCTTQSSSATGEFADFSIRF
jgi:acylphosphatase